MSAGSIVGSLIPSLIGLGAKAGTAARGLRKPKRTDAGARAAMLSGRKLSGRAVGAAQTGHGASRGLALREGLRAGEDIASEAAAQSAKAAITDDQLYNQRLDKRNANLASFGTDLAKGLGDMAAGIIKPEDAEAEDPAAEERAPVDVSPSGFGTPQDESSYDPNINLDDLENDDQQQFIDDAAMQLEDFKLKREEAGISAAPPEPSAEETTASLIDQAYSTQPQMAPEVEKELAQTLHLKSLMLAEMERQGMSFESLLPRVNRRLNLNPGQSLQNPLGLGPDSEVG